MLCEGPRQAVRRSPLSYNMMPSIANTVTLSRPLLALAVVTSVSQAFRQSLDCLTRNHIAIAALLSSTTGKPSLTCSRSIWSIVFVRKQRTRPNSYVWTYYMVLYFGPPEGSGQVQRMLLKGHLRWQVLQCRQLEGLAGLTMFWINS